MLLLVMRSAPRPAAAELWQRQGAVEFAVMTNGEIIENTMSFEPFARSVGHADNTTLPLIPQRNDGMISQVMDDR